VIRHHFLDSLSCVLSSLIRPHIRILDIGTGAGFPGIPLKIYAPDIYITAVDTVSKKVIFLRQLCRLLELHDVECVASRIEHLAFPPSSPWKPGETREKQLTVRKNSFDVVVSRAVGTIPYLLELAKPLLAPDGHVILQRGRNGKQEIFDQTHVLQETGFQVRTMIEVRFSFFEYPRYLMVFRQKENNKKEILTPSAFLCL
jgi:16S rRNA (guanine527-N7)-methyltransferase